MILFPYDMVQCGLMLWSLDVFRGVLLQIKPYQTKNLWIYRNIMTLKQKLLILYEKLLYKKSTLSMTFILEKFTNHYRMR